MALISLNKKAEAAQDSNLEEVARECALMDSSKNENFKKKARLHMSAQSEKNKAQQNSKWSQEHLVGARQNKAKAKAKSAPLKRKSTVLFSHFM